MTLDEALSFAIEALREPENNYPDDPGDGESFPLGQGNAAAAVLERLREGLPMLVSASRKFVDKCDTGRARSVETYAELSAALARLDPPSEERT